MVLSAVPIKPKNLRTVNHKRLRLVVYTIDISNIDSMTFFRHKYNILISKGFFPVLQNELV